jgi:uncharacterized protein (TIGR03437 family)
MKLGLGSFNASENPGYLRNRIDPNAMNQPYPGDDSSFGLYRSFSGDRWSLEAKVGYGFPAPYLAGVGTGRRFFLHVIFGDVAKKGQNEVTWVRERTNKPSAEVTDDRVIVQFIEGGTAAGVPQSGLGGDPARGVAFAPGKADTYVVRILREGQQLTVQQSADGEPFTTVAQRTFGGALGSVQTALVAAAWSGAAAGYAEYDYIAAAPADSAPPVAITSVSAAFGGADIAQNTWIEIKGTGLAPGDLGANGFTWSTAPEFASGKMPTQLRGVGVTVNGKPAYVYYISPVQVNVLTPLDGTEGPVQVQVTNGGAASAPFTVNVKAIAPSFFLLGGTKHIAATHADGSLLGPSSMSVPGYPFAPARPDETIILYANGFGLPAVPLTDGSSTQFGALPALPVIQIGGTTAVVAFAGVVSPGLYQFNVIVPSAAANGDNLVTAAYAGSTTPAGALFAVQR